MEKTGKEDLVEIKITYKGKELSLYFSKDGIDFLDNLPKWRQDLFELKFKQLKDLISETPPNEH